MARCGCCWHAARGRAAEQGQAGFKAAQAGPHWVVQRQQAPITPCSPCGLAPCRVRTLGLFFACLAAQESSQLPSHSLMCSLLHCYLSNGTLHAGCWLPVRCTTSFLAASSTLAHEWKVAWNNSFEKVRSKTSCSTTYFSCHLPTMGSQTLLPLCCYVYYEVVFVFAEVPGRQPHGRPVCTG